jgi:hypothetical protein
MDIRIQCLSIDSPDPAKIASFWAAALGWHRPLDEPDGKTVKNRLHLDLRPKDQAAEVARLEALGARRVDVGQAADVTWVVLADPDGNEFCVLRALRPDELDA